MVGCSAFHCSSRSEKKIPEITFHRFPCNAERQQLWVKSMKLRDWEPTKHDRICSVHFEEKWFYRTDGRRKLLNQAVPTIFSEYPSYAQEKTDGRKRPLTPPADPEPSTSAETAETAESDETPHTSPMPLVEVHVSSNPATSDETPLEKKLRKMLWREKEKSKQKSKKIRVLGQALKRCRERNQSLKILEKILGNKHFITEEEGAMLENLSDIHEELVRRKVGNTTLGTQYSDHENTENVFKTTDDDVPIEKESSSNGHFMDIKNQSEAYVTGSQPKKMKMTETPSSSLEPLTKLQETPLVPVKRECDTSVDSSTGHNDNVNKYLDNKMFDMLRVLKEEPIDNEYEHEGDLKQELNAMHEENENLKLKNQLLEENCESLRSKVAELERKLKVLESCSVVS